MQNWKAVAEDLLETISRHCDEHLTDDVDAEANEELEEYTEDGFDFHVTFKLKHNGMLGFDFDWADDVHPAMSAQAMGAFLTMIQSGQIQEQTIDGLRGYGIQMGTSDMTELIVQKLVQLSEQYNGRDVAIKPQHIFAPPQGPQPNV